MTNWIKFFKDIIGGFSGDGGAAQDDSVKASLDITHTEVGKVPKSDGSSSWNATALQAIQDEAEDALEGEDLDHLLKLDGTAQKYPENCATDSVLAKLIAKGDPAVPSTFDCTTDSLEAISDAITAIGIRRVASGPKTIAAGVTKYLSIDSGTNGAEIIGIVIKGVVLADWTLEVYVPAVDAVAGPVDVDKRDENTYLAADTEGGMLYGFAVPYNCFLDFTNDAGAPDDIDDVVIMYRSADVLTLAWEA